MYRLQLRIFSNGCMAALLGKSSELNTKELEVTKVGNLKYLLSIMKYLLIRKMVGKQPLIGSADFNN